MHMTSVLATCPFCLLLSKLDSSNILLIDPSSEFEHTRVGTENPYG